MGKKDDIKKGVKKGVKRVPWQRLSLSLLGISVVAGMWRWAIFHLYTLPDHSISSFNSITNNAFYVIGAIIIFMVSGRLIYEWKNETASTVIEQATHIAEEHLEKKEVEVHKTVDVNVKEQGINAPDIRPFSMSAIGDAEEGEYHDF